MDGEPLAFRSGVVVNAGGRGLNNGGNAGEGILATYPNVNTEEILCVNPLGSIRMDTGMSASLRPEQRQQIVR